MREDVVAQTLDDVRDRRAVRRRAAASAPLVPSVAVLDEAMVRNVRFRRCDIRATHDAQRRERKAPAPSRA